MARRGLRESFGPNRARISRAVSRAPGCSERLGRPSEQQRLRASRCSRTLLRRGSRRAFSSGLAHSPRAADAVLRNGTSPAANIACCLQGSSDFRSIFLLALPPEVHGYSPLDAASGASLTAMPRFIAPIAGASRIASASASDGPASRCRRLPRLAGRDPEPTTPTSTSCHRSSWRAWACRFFSPVANVGSRPSTYRGGAGSGATPFGAGRVFGVAVLATVSPFTGYDSSQAYSWLTVLSFGGVVVVLGAITALSRSRHAAPPAEARRGAGRRLTEQRRPARPGCRMTADDHEQHSRCRP